MNRNIIIAFILLLAGALACEIPAGMNPTPVIVTQIVVVPNQQVPATATLPVPTVPAAALTPVATTTPISTATLSGPTITFVKNANCRNGPGTKFNVVTSYLKGQTLKIVGRNPDVNNTWWQVEIPTGGKCWVSLATGQATGPYDDIPTIP